MENILSENFPLLLRLEEALAVGTAMLPSILKMEKDVRDFATNWTERMRKLQVRNFVNERTNRILVTSFFSL